MPALDPLGQPYITPSPPGATAGTPVQGPPAIPGNALYSDILRVLGVPADVIAQGGMWNGIPTNPNIRPPNITPAIWTSRPQSAGLPGWASMIIGTASQLSPENKSKLFQHWVNKQGIAPQWADIAAARPAWATELMRQQFAGMGITG